MPPRSATTLFSHHALFPASRPAHLTCARAFQKHQYLSHQQRYESSSRKRRTEGNWRPAGPPAKGNTGIGEHQSIATRNKDGMRKQIPNDLGILPGTLIMPTGPDMPKLFTTPLKRGKIEFDRLYKRFRDLISVIGYKWQQKPRLKLHFRQTAPTAVALHRQMYTALAEGDLQTITPHLCDGLREQFASRVALRRPATRYEWTLHRYTSPARVVSHRATILPIDDGSGNKPALRQAVVQIKSVQSLRLIDERGAAVRETDGKKEEDIVEKEFTEYIVVQRKVWRGIEERWRVWGTVEETKMEDWAETMDPKVDPEKRVKAAQVQPVEEAPAVSAKATV